MRIGLAVGWRAGVAAALCLAAFTLAPRPAAAWCQSNSCDEIRGETCSTDLNGCRHGAFGLFWPSSCVTFAVQQDGSMKHGIDAGALEDAVNTAFQTWMAADCGEGNLPSISVMSLGRVACDAVEYNKDQGNANIFMFRDADWPHSPLAYALTTVQFDPKSGKIYDADSEINGDNFTITNSAPEDGADLLSIVTHETGHFLGLDHSNVQDATMFLSYTDGKPGLRDLDPDDMAGICSIYPADRVAETDNCDPRHGFQSSCHHAIDEGCGCRLGPATRGNGAPIAMGLLALALVRVRARRSRRR